MARAAFLAAAFTTVLASEATAEWQLKPFAGLSFKGNTTFLDFEEAAGKKHLVYGVSALWLGDLIGLETDLSHAPGFFESGDQELVSGSRVTTVTGNAILAMPRHLTEYTLRPYLVGGVGVMFVRLRTPDDVFRVSRRLTAVDIGGGVTGFLTDRIGLNWEVRRFRSVGGNDTGEGLSIGAEKLSFWRATMALAVRY